MAKVVKQSESITLEAKIGGIMKENPDWTFEFIKELLISKEEALAGRLEPYNFDEK